MIAAVACIDLSYPEFQSCEVGDCVVLPKYQSKSLMQHLFYSLEQKAKERGNLIFSFSHS